MPSALGLAVSYTHLRAHETSLHLVCRLLLEKKNLVAVGAGAAQGASLTLGLALLAMFALATITGVLKKKSSEAPSNNHS